MRSKNADSSGPKLLRVARIASDKQQVPAKVMDAEFPILLKAGTEVLAQHLGRNQFLVMVAYGLATAELVLNRTDLIFS